MISERFGIAGQGFLLGVIATGMLVAACGDDESSEPDPPQSEEKITVDDVDANYSFDIVETPFGPLECVYASRYSKDGGPSCNWEKFNADNDTEG